MGNEEYIINSDNLSPQALEKKTRLEQDPSSRTNHMEYMPGMEQICHTRPFVLRLHGIHKPGSTAGHDKTTARKCGT